VIGSTDQRDQEGGEGHLQGRKSGGYAKKKGEKGLPSVLKREKSTGARV